jgi:plasmid replication initiation protein
MNLVKKAEHHKMLKVYKDQTMCKACAFVWFNRFQEGRGDVMDYKKSSHVRSSRLIKMWNNLNVEK